MAEQGSIQSVERVFKIIEAMCREKESSVTGLSKATGLNKATVFRFLNTLVTIGYVIKMMKPSFIASALNF